MRWTDCPALMRRFVQNNLTAGEAPDKTKWPDAAGNCIGPNRRARVRTSQRCWYLNTACGFRCQFVRGSARPLRRLSFWLICPVPAYQVKSLSGGRRPGVFTLRGLPRRANAAIGYAQNCDMNGVVLRAGRIDPPIARNGRVSQGYGLGWLPMPAWLHSRE